MYPYFVIGMAIFVLLCGYFGSKVFIIQEKVKTTQKLDSVKQHWIIDHVDNKKDINDDRKN